MLDVLFVALFLGLPLATWLVSRSLTWTATRLILAFGLGGNAAQTAVAWGVPLSVRGLQAIAVALMVIVLLLGLAWRRRKEGRPASLRRQVWGVLAPALVIGAFLLLMRLLAPETASPLAGLGYLVNHPLAEDNAKWLHLTSQLATGETIVFNGYAGGPLLLLMSVVAALITVLSMVLLGGVNEVAVAVNTLLFTQFLLIALVPFALAPFAENRGRTREGQPLTVPLPAVWASAFVLFVISAVVTSYGHLSFQFILIILTLWASAFLLPGRDRHGRIVMTLAIATSASVWVPLNVLGLVLVLGLVGWSLWRRRWLSAVLAVVTLAVCWDALLSSTLYLLGLGGIMTGAEAGGSSGGATEAAGASSEVSLPSQVLAATHLFEAPGGTEIVQPILALLAVVTVLFVAARHPMVRGYAHRWRGLVPLAPIAVLGVYVLGITLGDAILTGSAPNYGGHKLALAWTVMALAATLPLAITYLDSPTQGMTVLRWLAVGAVPILLMLDTLLPRAISALSPTLWPGVDASAPAYWVPAEVKDQPEQPISSLPVACLFTPPQSPEPSALPLGQQSYSCTRLLLGLNGLEGMDRALITWLGTDWLSNERTWSSYYESLSVSTAPITGRTVILMNPEYGVAGLAPWSEILRQNPPTPAEP